ncbi:unnamed protein product [Cyprideis torosa]|uniref:Uncharacterized protein n=1 Tax=Cyprideis torosa TaxID=163714 RepID=A0A7R8WPL9_9CRUS|nr:unnamed protein product [Cyprideis torosa]CAG0905784.1 unnamed protein product [Cyprideis torosa]
MDNNPPFFSPEWAKIILESISEGVFTVDQNFIITSFNHAAQKITGFTSKEAVGQPCQKIFRSDRCEGDCTLKKTLLEKRAIQGCTTNIVNKEGKRVPISLSTSLLRNEEGDILGGVEIFRDETVLEGLRREIEGRVETHSIITKNREMRQLLSFLPQVGASDATVLIEAETGTGKELLARAIHNLSGRKDSPFTAINCGALPDTLLESELFGYKAGAFTGANKDKPGIFQSSGKGTILLDEIGDTSPAFQVKLLRLLEEREFQPLGGVSTLPFAARILAATNKDLAAMVREGKFRKDLFYRINIIHLCLPPLRDRREDIPLLVDSFIDKFNMVKNTRVEAISRAALAILMAHHFPGNIRELENILEYCFVVCQKDTIQPHHLPPFLHRDDTTWTGRKTEQKSMEPYRDELEDSERNIILKALKKHSFNRTTTARALGMHKSTLYRKITKLGIHLPAADGRSHHSSNHSPFSQETKNHTLGSR